MRLLKIARLRIRSLVRPEVVERELDDELRFHLERQVEEYVARGRSPDEARRQALRDVGALARWKDACRDERRVPRLEELLQDARFGARTWRRQPGLALLIVAMLAVGIGANVAMFDLVDALMFRSPAHVRVPERLVTLDETENYVQFTEVRDRARTVDVAAHVARTLSLGIGADAGPARIVCVTSAYFEILGVAPALGRTFRSVAADAPTAVISYGLWQRQFARAPDVLGRTVRLDARLFEIVGVMPRGFKGLDTDAIDGWIPLTAAPDSCSLTGESLLGSSNGSWLGTIGRLRDDATLEEAAAELEALLPPEDRFDRALESSPSRLVTPVAQTRRERLSRDNRLAWWLAGGAVVVLLIACANVAGLLSMRAVDRRREMAVRLQLGAGRRRLLRQLAAEHLVLALACGLAALGVAAWLGAVLARFFPYGAPDLASPRVFLAAAGVSLMAGLLSGLPLARQASGIDGTALTRTARIASRDSAAFRAALLVAQVALALVLAVGAGLFVRSVSNTRQNMGIDVDRIVVAAVDLVRGGYRGDAETTTAFERMAELLRRQPDIESVALSSGSLLGAGGFSSQFLLRPSRDSRSGAGRTMQFVSPDYFRTLGTDVQSGRAFSDADVAGSEPVIIVDRILASEVWPGRDPVGECAFTGTTCLRVVGVTEPRRSSAALRARGEMFRPHSQAGGHFRPQMLVVRPRGAPEAAVGGIAAVIRSAVNDLPFVNVRPLEDLSDEQTRSWRLGRLMFGAFGVVAMAMAAIGLYAVLVFHARQRTAEIGVRLALGATRADILRLVMRQGLTLVAAGWALGAVTAFALADRIQGLLFDVSATDLATFVVASAAILAAGIAGCLVPAARAARVDPVVALRTE